MLALSDLRVVELATGIAGPYAGKLFADAGADVVKVESIDGDPLRRRSASGADLGGEDGALFRFLNASKRSVVGDPSDAHVEELVAGADLVIESYVPGRPDVDAWLGRWPQLVVLAVTPFGRSGPWRDRPASGFTVQAESGSIGARGRPDGVPFQAGGRTAEWCAGVFGAVGAFAAVTRARASGRGTQVDSPWLPADHLSTNPNMSMRHNLLGRPPITSPARVVDAPSIERTKDGFIGLNTNTRQQFEDFLRMIEQVDLLEDERWASADFRVGHLDEWKARTSGWFLDHTTDEVMDMASLWRIPVAPVNDAPAMLEQEHYRVRGIFGASPHGFVQPLPPYRIDGVRPAPRGPAPGLGEHTGSVEPRTRPAPVGSSADALPFAGVRVLDATAMVAGPTVGLVFGALGADVIHLESIQRLDLARLKVDSAYGSPQWWERGQNWFMVGPNKRDLTLDLGDERGRELVERLVAECDVVVENFSPRVFDRFGLTPERLRELNPRVVFARMPAFGLDGPWRDNVGFAQTMEQVSGMAWITGHPTDPAPSVPRGPCDSLAGYQALFTIFVALWRRQRNGEGAFLELAMAESAVNAAAELVVEYTAYGRRLERNGNRSCDAAPQGLYRCDGDDSWLALSIEDDEQWAAAKRIFGHPAWTEGPELATGPGRQAGHDRLDAEIGAWAATQDATFVVAQLVAAGVPAATVTDPRLAHEHPQLAGWGYFEAVDHPIAGCHPAPSLPFRFADIDRWLRTPAPLLGEHNEAILCGLLGVAPAELVELEAREVIGTAPLGTNPSFNL